MIVRQITIVVARNVCCDCERRLSHIPIATPWHRVLASKALLKASIRSLKLDTFRVHNLTTDKLHTLCYFSFKISKGIVMPLYRKEAVAYRSQRLPGHVSLGQPLLMRLTVSCLMVITLVIGVFIFNGQTGHH